MLNTYTSTPDRQSCSFCIAACEWGVVLHSGCVETASTRAQAGSARALRCCVREGFKLGIAYEGRPVTWFTLCLLDDHVNHEHTITCTNFGLQPLPQPGPVVGWGRRSSPKHAAKLSGIRLQGTNGKFPSTRQEMELAAHGLQTSKSHAQISPVSLNPKP